ncbi:MAG: STAS domain-containing protein [Leptospiraceae bacterium]|nr:STAS domain-containing protein [Leptospiraceae bacterium]MCP5496015.1 STAS domain-containing protein [Leptospiraceae bacterium]
MANIIELTIQTEKIDNIFVMRLQGALNAFTTNKFLDEVKTSLKKGGLILDMEELNLISSIGVKAIKEVLNISFNAEKKIILLNLSTHAKQVFDMMKLTGLFIIAPNEEIAMKKASNLMRLQEK